MALYLNNLDLNGNQLQKAVVHPLSTAPSTAQEGQIYYDTGASAVYVNTSTTPSSPAWVSMAGDMTGITLTGGNGITATNTNSSGGAYSSTITLDISDSTLTTATAIAQADLLAFSDESVTNEPTKNITFSNLEDQIFSNINSASSDIAIAAGGAITVNTLNQSTTGNAATATKLAAAVNIGGVSFDGSASITLVSGSIPNNAADTTGNADTATKIASITNSDIVQLTATQTLTNKTIAASQVTEISSLTAHEGAQLENIGGTTTISAAQWGYLGAATGAITNTDVSVSATNLKTTLGGVFGSSALAIGTSAETVTVKGDFVVDGSITLKGDTVLESTTNTAIRDKILLLNQGASTTSDLAVLWERAGASNPSVALKWNESDDQFELIVTTATGSEANGAIEVVAEGEDGQAAGLRGYQNLRLSKAIVEAINLDGNTITGINNSGEFDDDDAHIMTSAGINDRFALINADTTGNAATATKISSITNSNIVQLAETQTLTNKTLTSPTLTTPALGTPASGTLTNCTFPTLNQSTTGNAATATKISSITNSNIVQLATSQTLTSKTLTSPVLNTGVSGTAIKDQDDMSSNSATHLATQQSIKAYVDAQTSGDSNTGGRQAFSLTNAGSVAATNSGKTFTITHGMGASLNYGVEVIRAANGSGETVYTDVTRTTTTIVIDFAVAPTAGDYTALVCKY